MSIAAQYRRVKNVFSNFNAGDIDKVLVTGGRIYATDSRIIVSTPFDCALDFLVDGAKFGGAIVRKGASLRLDNDTLVIDADASTEYLTTGEVTSRTRPDGKWQPLPEQLLEAFRALRPFQSEDMSREWACSVTARRGHLFATNNFIFAIWEAPELGDLDVAFPSWLVAYVLDIGEPPAEMCLHNDWIGLRWEDETEVLAFRLQREMEDKIVNMGLSVEKVGQELPKGFLSAIHEAAGIVGCETLTITPTEIIGESQEDRRVVKFASPTDKPVYFDPNLLLPVLTLATHLDLEAAPDPSSWYGDGVRGLIAGKVK